MQSQPNPFMSYDQFGYFADVLPDQDSDPVDAVWEALTPTLWQSLGALKETTAAAEPFADFEELPETKVSGFT